jgi:hypothetical protein
VSVLVFVLVSMIVHGQVAGLTTSTDAGACSACCAAVDRRNHGVAWRHDLRAANLTGDMRGFQAAGKWLAVKPAARDMPDGSASTIYFRLRNAGLPGRWTMEI